MKSLKNTKLKRTDIVSGTYHAWRGDPAAGAYADVPGFCKAVRILEIAQHDYILTPRRYVGAEDVEDDGEPFEEKMQRLTKQLEWQFEQATQLENQIRSTMRSLGYGN